MALDRARPDSAEFNSIDIASAATATQPEMDLLEASVLSGAVWRLAACAAGCRCAEKRWQQEFFQEDIARLGLTPKAGGEPSFKRARKPQGTRKQRDLDLLFEIVVSMRRPPVLDWCDTLQRPVTVYYGRSIYEAKDRDLLRDRSGEISRRHAGLAEWLERRSGKLRTPYGLRLRRAGMALREEAANPLERGPEASQTAAGALAEAALIQSGTAPNLRSVLLDEPTSKVSGTETQELVYLARAGRRPLRFLAALRLAGASSGQAAATLGQLLWEEYSPLAEAALWSLSVQDPASAARGSSSVVRGMLEEDSLQLRSSIVAAALSASAGSEIPDLLLHAYETVPLRPEVCEMVQFIAGI